MRIAVTGAEGFLGWHTLCALKARGTDEVTSIGRDTASVDGHLDRALLGTDAVLHLAGVNRSDPDKIRAGNIDSARRLTESLDRVGARPVIVYANSIQAGDGSPFAESKQAASEHLVRWGTAVGCAVADVYLPNLFGEHGRPHYNSVVATFCYELAHGQEAVVVEDRTIPLLHVQDAVDALLDLVSHQASGSFHPQGHPTRVSALLGILRDFRDLYASGEIPDIADPLHRALFNTYRSFCFPDNIPIHPALRSDARGVLFECLRGHGGQAQVFCSSTRPGGVRGEHFHRRKVERFLVLRGTGQIMLRRLFHGTVVRFDVSGERPAIVDMPTMWAHSIVNTGSDELLTLFWADELLDLANSDTYTERVELTTVSR
jgi:UDP-2-acetamido-2,6-beta-L-arabino-hexul-4-ose reductase